jgi:endogenous inhibitor of DNA gyrase (YacG/DUF329 family)
MIRCPRCLGKINRELHDVADPIKCPSCRQEVNNLNAFSVVSFPDCVSSVRYVGLNTWENASLLLKMMQ